jgi:hypothetical protein
MQEQRQHDRLPKATAPGFNQIPEEKQRGMSWQGLERHDLRYDYAVRESRRRYFLRGCAGVVTDSFTRSAPVGSVTMPSFSIPAFLTLSITCTTIP